MRYSKFQAGQATIPDPLTFAYVELRPTRQDDDGDTILTDWSDIDAVTSVYRRNAAGFASWVADFARYDDARTYVEALPPGTPGERWTPVAHVSSDPAECQPPTAAPVALRPELHPTTSPPVQ